MAVKTLVIAEHRGEEIRDVTWEILSGLDKLAGAHGMEVHAVILGYGHERLAQELSGAVAKLYYMESEELKFYTCERYLSALMPLIKEVNPKLVIMGHTAMGMDLAPRLAAAMDSPYMPDCIDFGFDAGCLIVTRELFGGKLRSEVKAVEDQSYVLTLRSGVFAPKAREGEKQVEKMVPQLGEKGFLTQFLGLTEPPKEGVDITKADIIIGVGRGIGDKDKLQLVEEFAEVTGGVLAATRPVIDKGWLPKERQVGQSGKIVKPKLYVACGISGASQHTIGIKKSETIVAINVDPHAPIFNIAHYGVVGDLFEILPAIISKIKSIKSLNK